METALTTTATNLPAETLPPQSQRALQRVLAATLSIAEAQRLSTLPLVELRTELGKLRAAQDTRITQAECDACLKMLVLGIPRANMSPKDTDDMLDLYHALLSNKGVTAPMMVRACEKILMAPPSPKGRWFPYPGEIFEHCAEDVSLRNRTLAMVDNAFKVIGSVRAEPPESESLVKVLDNVLARTGRVSSLDETLRSYAATRDAKRGAA